MVKMTPSANIPVWSPSPQVISGYPTNEVFPVGCNLHWNGSVVIVIMVMNRACNNNPIALHVSGTAQFFQDSKREPAH
eukprot:CAMPEP_0204421700 /NCGR_PEP_ID=MMETSP0470-20130426/35062_1 /ASSEMBLY_ACC=CAM_ASM_000385 /TAXON_ID=2969 /ORGANISM="Oxyrrhis marina" /LENGTH=77 /DNA_ID=CAMNT_0051418857 /DNA_START=113 /DNA_END=343 /DNA_ORIENTATION=+